jgi:hypothetical protein
LASRSPEPNGGKRVPFACPGESPYCRENAQFDKLRIIPEKDQTVESNSFFCCQTGLGKSATRVVESSRNSNKYSRFHALARGKC